MNDINTVGALTALSARLQIYVYVYICVHVNPILQLVRQFSDGWNAAKMSEKKYRSIN